MLKSIARPVAVVAALLLLPMSTGVAWAQSAPLYINLVDLDIVPAFMNKFLAALKENGAASVKEPGCRELDITVSQKDPNHVFVFEVYNNAAAWDAHQGTAHFMKFYGITAQMMIRYDIRPFSSVAMNANATAQSGPLLINAIDLDVVPEQFDKFTEAAKANAAASVQDPGTHAFNIVVSQKDPHHLFFFEVYDDAAALDAHRAADHYKQYQAATKDMVATRDVKKLTSVAMDAKGM